MSFLGVDDRASRSRSKSGNRDRSRSRSAVRVPSPPKSQSYGYAPSTTSAGPMPGSFDDGPTSAKYDVRSPPGVSDRSNYFPSSNKASSKNRAPPDGMPYPTDDGGFTMGDYSDFPPNERPGYVGPDARFPQMPQHHDDDDLAYGNASPVTSRHQSYNSQYPGQHSNSQPQYREPSDSDYRYTPQSATDKYGSKSYQYAKPPENITYTAKPATGSRTTSYTQSTEPYSRDAQRHNSYTGRPDDTRTVDITPGRDKRDRAPSNAQPHRLSVSTQQLSLQPQPGLSSGMHRLSLSSNRPDMGNMPPPSPLLEAYRGTYQSLSPMPMALRPDDDDDMSDLEPLEAPSSRKGHAKDKLSREAEAGRVKDRGGKDKKRVTLYDPEDDAKKIAKALNHSKPVAEPIIDILPGLTHDQTWELRKEYKKQVKIQGKGISLPKHLKLKLTGNFGKVAYVTTLGRFESEGYWANFWYQSHGSRRELLIESLMGRTNADIRNIKDEFKDKRYSDSLEKCMEKELKMDKFRAAILMALEERRQEELDVYPPEYVNRDVEMLFRSLSAKQGGESAMLDVVVRRSDAHLRRVLDLYQRQHGENFARAALRKSNNLIGEVVAHILNGVINKPVRDAILLNHAIKDIAEKNKNDDLRYELLISRLTRVHWDKMHLERVKRAYMDKFRTHLQEDIEDATKGDFRDFMCELAESK
ncbi:hypothetical protein LTR78_009407 [Recurvomyces mirabilis]|uniref:Annexin n=1 Tax=Recurvomyces mirabilis TaxID=574656 RepID=A0AAE0TPF9_9PEZI|nr:hypothetical protein LTR78_009407 [Recurvomyces mirabilis]KAK5154305.1 hypothetical protein LTS14_006990 [Recurvomyces mirabilis]